MTFIREIYTPQKKQYMVRIIRTCAGCCIYLYRRCSLQVELIRRDYVANSGWETFLSYEDPEQGYTDI